jgi:hypothetical protein
VTDYIQQVQTEICERLCCTVFLKKKKTKGPKIAMAMARVDGSDQNFDWFRKSLHGGGHGPILCLVGNWSWQWGKTPF